MAKAQGQGQEPQKLRVEVKGISTFLDHEGADALSCNVYFDGKLVGKYSDDAWDIGNSIFRFKHNKHGEAFNRWLEDFREKHNLTDFEVFNILASWRYTIDDIKKLGKNTLLIIQPQHAKGKYTTAEKGNVKTQEQHDSYTNWVNENMKGSKVLARDLSNIVEFGLHFEYPEHEAVIRKILAHQDVIVNEDGSKS